MDNNKSLLNEATIKRFMKLASLKPLSNDFVMRLSETEAKEPVTEQESAEETARQARAFTSAATQGAAKADPKAWQQLSDEDDAELTGALMGQKAASLKEGGAVYNEDDEVSPEDLGGGDLDLPEEGGEEALEGAPLTVAGVESALESGLNALVAELEAGIPGLELSVDGNGEEDLGGEELPGEGEEVGLGGPPPEDIDVALAERKIVETVVARVASRLKNRVKKERIAEALTEKIFQRLTKK